MGPRATTIFFMRITSFITEQQQEFYQTDLVVMLSFTLLSDHVSSKNQVLPFTLTAPITHWPVLMQRPITYICRCFFFNCLVACYVFCHVCCILSSLKYKRIY